MPNPITKTDVVFNDLRITRELQPSGEYDWYVDVSYRVVTDEGEDFPRSRRVELTGAKLAAAKNYLLGVYNDIKAEEGIA